MEVLVVGGGIAGPVTAMALQQAGLTPTIVEARDHNQAEVGSWLTLSPNGLDALDAIGVLHHVTGVGFPTRRIVLHTDRGRRLGDTPLGQPLNGVPAQTLKRSWLSSRLLAEAKRRQIAVHHGRRLVGARAVDEGVIAELDDGGTLRADLLVGADGIHSLVRRLIDRASPSGRYVGLTNFGGITRGAAPDGEREAWHMIFGRRAFFGWSVTPDGDTAWFANWPRPPIAPHERATTSRDQWRTALAELFARDAGPAADLIRAGELDLVADNTYDLPRVPAWQRESMVLVGDAAHAPAPTSGQGASMAAEDGVVLAKALRDLPTVRQALEAYERSRRPRAERIVTFGARGSRSKAAGPVRRPVTNALMPLALRLFATERSTAWIYNHRIEWNASMPQPPAVSDASTIKPNMRAHERR